MTKTAKDYKKFLSHEQYRISREGGTEAPFSGEYCSLFEPGNYFCVCCGIPLFTSEAKYESDSGWPDFTDAIAMEAIKYVEEGNGGGKRIEVKCNNCDAHLGHIFDDGPPPDFKRY